jgi:hypothetical protein
LVHRQGRDLCSQLQEIHSTLLLLLPLILLLPLLPRLLPPLLCSSSLSPRLPFTLICFSPVLIVLSSSPACLQPRPLLALVIYNRPFQPLWLLLLLLLLLFRAHASSLSNSQPLLLNRFLLLIHPRGHLPILYASILISTLCSLSKNIGLH